MDFHLPELGEGVYEAELVAWHVKPGDGVKRGQSLAEVLTDKASMELPAPFAGTITELRVQPGQVMKIGSVILTYASEKAAAEKRGDGVKPRKGDKARGSEPAAGPVDGGSWAAAAAPGPPLLAATVSAAPAAAGVRAAPSVRLMARQLGIDLARVPGTGPGGRILIRDLSDFARTLPIFSRESQAAPQRPAEPRPDYGTPGTRIKLIGVRRKIADHLQLAKRTIPHYSYIDECEVTELVRLRESLKEAYTQAGIKLTYLAFFVKAAVAALKEVPIVNSSLDEQAGEIVLHDRYHIGIAVAAPSGLIVPVVHDADKKDLTEIAREIDRLSADARAGRAKLEDLRGGTFTITSIGNVGGLISTPVINHPEVAILGIGKIVRRPVYDATGNLRPADLLYLSFSFDHRVLDGAVGAVFGNAIVRRLQQPATLLLPEFRTSPPPAP